MGRRGSYDEISAGDNEGHVADHVNFAQCKTRLTMLFSEDLTYVKHKVQDINLTSTYDLPQ